MSDQMHLGAMDGMAFVTDRIGVIQDIGENNWNAFAQQNGAAILTAKEVRGRNLFDFIEGEQVQGQFRQIMDRLAEDPNWSWVLRFRCDSPARERRLRQYVRPVFNNHSCDGFLFHTVEDSTRKRPPIPLFDFETMRRNTTENPDLPIVKMCSWCQRVQFPGLSDPEWIEAEAYYAAGGSSAVQISHAICSDCLKLASPF